MNQWSIIFWKARMSINFQILGEPGRDNSLYIQVDSGQAFERILFDCGENTLGTLPISEIKEIDHLFFSHLHMDHIGGFDTFFRCNYARDTKLNQIWGPPGTADIIQNRFRGFLWNLHDQMNSSWNVSDVHSNEVHSFRYELNEAFEVVHKEKIKNIEQFVFQGQGYTVECAIMNHRTPTLAYIVKEKPKYNIDLSLLESLGLRPGPWLKQIKEPSNNSDNIKINNKNYPLEELRQKLLVKTPGDSIAYLTDFLLEEDDITQLAEKLEGCKTVICEGQYRQSDYQLAKKNYHMTTVLSAKLAKKCNVEKLILFHLSDRYRHEDWIQMLNEAREFFPGTTFPDHWKF